MLYVIGYHILLNDLLATLAVTLARVFIFNSCLQIMSVTVYRQQEPDSGVKWLEQFQESEELAGAASDLIAAVKDPKLAGTQVGRQLILPYFSVSICWWSRYVLEKDN
jgi:hypothetical protein